MTLKGVDVSSYNGKIDWKEASKHIDFAVLRCHQTYGADETFEDNYKGCVSNGVPVGVYKFSYAKTIGQARTEARKVLKVLDGRRLQFPVFYDLGWTEQIALGTLKIQKITIAFLRLIVQAGYAVGIYCDKDLYDNYITPYLKKFYPFWIASYPANGTGEAISVLKPKDVYGWQYSVRGRIPGIGHTNMNKFYINSNEDVPFIREVYDDVEK